MAGYYLLNRYLINPITTIAVKVDSSKAGEIIDVEYSSDDDIGHLIKTFNEKTIYLETDRLKLSHRPILFNLLNNAELTYQVDKALEQVSLGEPTSQDVINIITVNLLMP